MSKLFQIPVIAGGRLITTLSKSMVGEADYVQKDNLRRDKDQEIRREGWQKFNPLAGPTDEYIFDAALTCLKTVELIRGDGTKALVGFSRSTVKLFDNTLGTWSTIGSGYSASGKRWQTVTINGTLVANNGVDLPIYWNIGDAAVTPMYELREVGVSCVGRIAENSGFLVIADITEIRAIQLIPWMNGYSSYVSGGSTAKAASFTALVGETTRTYQVTTGAVNTVATLPAVAIAGYAVELWYRIEKVDAGVGVITTSPVIEDQVVTLDSIGDVALVRWDIIAGKWMATVFPSGSVPATAPYGIPPSYITQRLPWSVASGEYGEPTKWAPAFQIYMPAASANIVLPFASSVFIAARTRVAVVSGGPLGGTLGGQEDTPEGVMVLAVSGATLTLEQSTNIDLDYPRVVTIMRWTDVSSLVGRYDLQGDGSEITSLATLRNWLIVCRTTGFYLGRYTGDPGAPFNFTPAYQGPNVPLWPDAIANVKSDYILYPAIGGRMYAYDGTSWPRIHQVCDDASSLFFGTDSQIAEIFCADNTITREWWWFYPDRTIAFDYDTDGGTVSKITQAFDSAAMIHKPGSTDLWFIIGITRFIYTNGLVFGITPIQTWLRDGTAVNSVLAYGLWSAKNQFQEKLLLSITPILSSQSPASPDIDVELGVSHNPNAAITQVLVPAESLPSPSGMNFVTTAFQAIYFQPKITVTETTDIDCRLSMLILEAELVGGAGVTRSIV